MQYLEVAERIFWPTRYIVLLWLSLICRLPFDLANFDAEGMEQNSTAQVVEDIGRQYLDKAGLEKDGAALLLARLYSRYAKALVSEERANPLKTRHVHATFVVLVLGHAYLHCILRLVQSEVNPLAIY